MFVNCKLTVKNFQQKIEWQFLARNKDSIFKMFLLATAKYFSLYNKHSQTSAWLKLILSSLWRSVQHASRKCTAKIRLYFQFCFVGFFFIHSLTVFLISFRFFFSFNLSFFRSFASVFNFVSFGFFSTFLNASNGLYLWHAGGSLMWLSVYISSCVKSCD